MTKVYVVTSGEYSDYGITAIFSTNEKAEAFMTEQIKFSTDMLSRDNYNIEVWEIDLPKESWIVTNVRMDKEGNTKDTWMEENGANGEMGFQTWDSEGNLVWGVVTTDKIRAVKVTNEKRVQLITNNLWLSKDLYRKDVGALINTSHEAEAKTE
jgi:hypothetical protein